MIPNNKFFKVFEFTKKLYNKDGTFCFSPANNIANLYTTCFGVMVLDTINKLRNFPKKEKSKIVNFIKKHQNKYTGLFEDKRIYSFDKKHTLEYIHLQLTDFSQITLSCLNEKPKYKYNFLINYKNEKFLKNWLDTLNWNDPWLTSNLIMFVLNFFVYEQKQMKINNKKFIEFIIEWLNNNQSKDNGFWNLGKKVSYHNQMGGAYHFLFFYTYLKIRPYFLERIIDSTLAIQDYDGLFNYSGGGGGCDDLDAIDLLCRATFYTDYRIEEIKEALKKSYNILIKNQNLDGGFCWAKRDFFSLIKIFYSLNFKYLKLSFRDFFSNGKSKLLNQISVVLNRKLTWKYSSLESMKINTKDSDLFSTWFRLVTIAFIEQTFPEIINNRKSCNWNLRKKCGVCFYKQG